MVEAEHTDQLAQRLVFPGGGLAWIGRAALLVSLAAVTAPHPAGAAEESDYYKLVTVSTSQASTESRSERWKPAPDGLVLEVSGLEVLDDDRVAVAIRKGEVWILDGVYDDPPSNVGYRRFARALHEPLGLLKMGDSLYTVQRSELTRLRDTDGDDEADEYLCTAKGWSVTGNYHEYAYGPKSDAEGNLWLALNIGLGLSPAQRSRIPQDTQPRLGGLQGAWRGWAMKVTPEGELVPVCGGLRSPSGLGANAAGDMFVTDQQGNWVGTCTLHHLRPGAFLGHPDALASIDLPGSTLQDVHQIPAEVPFPEAVRRLPALKPPAVWLPYKKAGQSSTDIVCDQTGGKFGPFEGQLFIGEFTLSRVSRVFLEQVDGEYQGAVFPFREGLASAVVRLAFGTDGSLFAGLTNRGWSSVGPASYGLQRLVWTGRVPFEIQEMRVLPDGFELRFTQPVSRESALNTNSYEMESYTYDYHEQYGSDEIQRETLDVRRAELSEDGRRVRLQVDGLRELYVHELRAAGVRSRDGEPLLHADAYYTLNRLPGGGRVDKSSGKR